MRVWLRIFIALSLLTQAAVGRAELAVGTWGGQFKLPPGLNGSVSTMVSVGNLLIVAGAFNRAGNVPARGIALWDGTKWSGLAEGVDGSIRAMAMGPDGLYVGGIFEHAGKVAAKNIARWNGARWEAVGGGVDWPEVSGSAYVNSLYVQNNRVYVGGSFTRAGGLSVANIAEWDGKMWHAMNGGLVLSDNPTWGFVGTITGDGRNIYAGGQFLRAGGISAKNLALWNGYTWRAMGNTVGGTTSILDEDGIFSGRVDRLAVHQGVLYVSGDFFGIGGVTALNFARWDGRFWQAVPMSTGWVSAMTSAGGNFYVAGLFERMGGVAATNLAVLANGQWSGSKAATPAQEHIQSVAFAGNRLFVGGDFGEINGVSAGFIAQANLGGWKALEAGTGNSLDRTVNSLAVMGKDVYAAGYFRTAGTKAIGGLVKWNGTNWTALPGQVSELGRFAVVSGTNLYYGGPLALPNGDWSYLSYWNGSAWTGVPDFHGVTYQLAASGDKLFVEGDFREFIREQFQSIRMWDGTNWTKLKLHSEGSDLAERLLGADETFVYVSQSTPLGNIQPQVARWDGVALEYLGQPFSNTTIMVAVASKGSNLYLGTVDYSNNQCEVYSWNGTSWEPLGFPTGGTVYLNCLAISKQGLYVGSRSQGLGNAPFNDLALWNGSRWLSLGNGVTGGASSLTAVNAMAVSGNKLYVGGNFSRAGVKDSGNFGVWEAK